MQSFVKALALGLMCLIAVACQARNEGDDKEKMPLSELLCIYTPSSCHGKKLLELYGAPPDALYERRFRDQVLHIPTGYISDTELLVDPRYSKAETALYLVALLPDLKPRERSNLREFFIPYDRNLINIRIGPRGPGAIPWEKSQQNSMRSAGEMVSPVRRPDKFGLEVYGEDFNKHPKRRPCEFLGADTSTCRRPHAEDILRPIHQVGKRSLMLCDPDVLPDIQARVEAMPNAEREAWYASKAGAGVRRAVCTHYMYYEPLNASVVLRYPRRFISQWQRTEQLVRELLDQAQEAPQPSQPAGKPHLSTIPEHPSK